MLKSNTLQIWIQMWTSRIRKYFMSVLRFEPRSLGWMTDTLANSLTLLDFFNLVDYFILAAAIFICGQNFLVFYLKNLEVHIFWNHKWQCCLIGVSVFLSHILLWFLSKFLWTQGLVLSTKIPILRNFQKNSEYFKFAILVRKARKII